MRVNGPNPAATNTKYHICENFCAVICIYINSFMADNIRVFL
jgi:hypothetical protein